MSLQEPIRIRKSIRVLPDGMVEVHVKVEYLDSPYDPPVTFQLEDQMPVGGTIEDDIVRVRFLDEDGRPILERIVTTPLADDRMRVNLSIPLRSSRTLDLLYRVIPEKESEEVLIPPAYLRFPSGFTSISQGFRVEIPEATEGGGGQEEVKPQIEQEVGQTVEEETVTGPAGSLASSYLEKISFMGQYYCDIWDFSDYLRWVVVEGFSQPAIRSYMHPVIEGKERSGKTFWLEWIASEFEGRGIEVRKMRVPEETADLLRISSDVFDWLMEGNRVLIIDSADRTFLRKAIDPAVNHQMRALWREKLEEVMESGSMVLISVGEGYDSEMIGGLFGPKLFAPRGFTAHLKVPLLMSFEQVRDAILCFIRNEKIDWNKNIVEMLADALLSLNQGEPLTMGKVKSCVLHLAREYQMGRYPMDVLIKAYLPTEFNNL